MVLQFARALRALPILLGMILTSGCTLWKQTEIPRGEPLAMAEGSGVIVGSVSAPFRRHYHETVAYHYRSLRKTPLTTGQITSATDHKYVAPHPFVPACSEVAIANECGRLFAIELPQGRYEFYRGEIIGRDEFNETSPLIFDVLPGKISYLGNLHTTYCVGMANRYRGNILGADLLVRDKFARDSALIRQRFPSLHQRPIDKQLLAPSKWRWRVSYRSLWGPSEPHDWGECSTGPARSR